MDTHNLRCFLESTPVVGDNNHVVLRYYPDPNYGYTKKWFCEPGWSKNVYMLNIDLISSVYSWHDSTTSSRFVVCASKKYLNDNCDDIDSMYKALNRFFSTYPKYDISLLESTNYFFGYTYRKEVFIVCDIHLYPYVLNGHDLFIRLIKRSYAHDIRATRKQPSYRISNGLHDVNIVTHYTSRSNLGDDQ